MKKKALAHQEVFNQELRLNRRPPFEQGDQPPSDGGNILKKPGCRAEPCDTGPERVQASLWPEKSLQVVTPAVKKRAVKRPKSTNTP